MVASNCLAAMRPRQPPKPQRQTNRSDVTASALRSVQFETLWFETLTAVCVGDIPPEQSLKMTGLMLASYRTDSIPCSQTTCVVTAAHACTSPQPTLCLAHGCWNLQGIAPKHRPPTHGLRSQGRAHVSTPPGGKMARQNLPSAQWEDGRAVPGNPS